MITVMGDKSIPDPDSQVPVIIACQELCKDFNGMRAVDGVTLRIDQGELLTVIGSSGCGKTTLLRLLAGFEAPDEGVVSVGGRLVAGSGTWVPPEDRQVGMVFQDYALFPHLTVAQNIEFGIKSWTKEARLERVEVLLDMVHLRGMGGRRPHQLSGGEQQRVALVRALAPRPLAIFLDEPFSNLDTRLRAAIREEVKAIVSELGITTIYVTHDQEEALFMGDRIAVMHRGRLEQVGAPEQIFLHPSSRFVARFMGVADFLSATVTAGGILSEVGYLTGATGFPVGASVDVLVRPDQVSVLPDEYSNAIVEARVYRGMDYLLTLLLPSGVRLHSLQLLGAFPANNVGCDVGDRVKLSISTGKDITCFPADAE